MNERTCNDASGLARPDGITQHRPMAAPAKRVNPERKKPTAPAARDPGGGELCDVHGLHPEAVRRTRARLRPAPNTRALADTFRALGDPTRLRIVEALSHGEHCVCDLGVLVGASQSVVSHSLRALRHLRLVRYRREGKVAYYALDDAHIASILAQGLDHVSEDTVPGAASEPHEAARGRRP